MSHEVSRKTSSLYPTEKSPLHLASQSSSHVKTYTAGEDKSRLAAAAQALGLKQHREPRPQVRKRRPDAGMPSLATFRHRTSLAFALLLDSAAENARIRSIYSQQSGDKDRSQMFLLDTAACYPSSRGPSENGHLASAGVGSLNAAVLGVVKGMVGPAILYLPHGFASAGYLIALPILMLTTSLYLYSSRCLLDCWARERLSIEEAWSESREESEVESDNATSSQTSPLVRKSPLSPPRIVLSYPELAFRGLGARGGALVKVAIALMQSGVCLTYLIFVPQNLHSSLQHLFGWNASPRQWLLVMMLLQIPLSFIRDIRHLTPTNLIANFLILYGLVTCLGLAMFSTTSNEEENRGTSQSLLQSLHPVEPDWYLFLGTTVLLFEGSITLLVPLNESIREREEQERFSRVYGVVILVIIAFYGFFGLTCLVAFGPNVQVVLTTSLPAGPLATSVQLAYALAIVLTFPLQNFPALEILCLAISESEGLPKSLQRMPRQLWSALMVTILALVAATAMDSLDKVVSLMGSLVGCPVAFVLPPLIHSSMCRPEQLARVWGNRLVSFFGLVAMVMSTYITLRKWI